MFKVLLTSVGGELAPQLIREMRFNSRHNIEVIGVDNNANANGKYFCNDFVTVPLGVDPGYIKKISEVVETYNIDLIIPTSDEEAVALSRSRAVVEQNGCRLACVDSKILDILSNKAKTYFFLKENGFKVPETKIINNYEDLKITVDQMFQRFSEVVVKPASGRGGRGVHVISSSVIGTVHFSDRREIHSSLSDFNTNLMIKLQNQLPIVVMERLIDPVFDIDLLAWNGKPKRVVTRKRINSAAPNEGHIIIDNEKLTELGSRLIQVFNLSWLYDCDVMFDSKGNPCVLELNPRQSGSLPVSIAAGAPMIDDLISLALGEEIGEADLAINKKIIPYTSLDIAIK